MATNEHAEPADHEHLPGDGHETVVHGDPVAHDDHVDHVHDGHRHFQHDDHVHEH